MHYVVKIWWKCNARLACKLNLFKCKINIAIIVALYIAYNMYNTVNILMLKWRVIFQWSDNRMYVNVNYKTVIIICVLLLNECLRMYCLYGLIKPWVKAAELQQNNKMRVLCVRQLVLLFESGLLSGRNL